MSAADLPFVCLSCRAKLEPVDATTLRCPGEGTLYLKTAGIWRFLEEPREEEAAFLERYATVRRDEGWGSGEAAYYRALPFRDLSGRHPEIWRIRAVSYRVFRRRLLRRLARRRAPLRILDLGAGNGWLSYRLAREGHLAVAVDLVDDDRDGLAACRHYPVGIAAVQASFDRLPWGDGQVDLVVYNGAFHYAEDYAVTLGEALRLLAPGGRVVVMDTPIYRREASGEQMLRERDAALQERYGFAPGARREGYLTRDRLDRLGRELGLEWRVIRPFYGLRWALIPWKARLRRRRELMRFHLIEARRKARR